MDPLEDPTKWPVATRGYKAFRPERKPETLSLRTSKKQEDNPLATYKGRTLAGEFARARVTTLLDAPETPSPLTFEMIGSEPKKENEPLAWKRASEDWNTGEQEENSDETEDSNLEVVDNLDSLFELIWVDYKVEKEKRKRIMRTQTIEVIDNYLRNTGKKVDREKYHEMISATAEGMTKRYIERQQAKGLRPSTSLSSYVLNEKIATYPMRDIEEQTSEQCANQTSDVYIIPPAGAKIFSSDSRTGLRSEATTSGMAQLFFRPYPPELEDRVNIQRMCDEDIALRGRSIYPDQGILIIDGIPTPREEIMRSGTALTQVKEEPMEEAEGRSTSSSPFSLPIQEKSQAPLSQPTFLGRLTNKTDPLLGMNTPTATNNNVPKGH